MSDDLIGRLRKEIIADAFSVGHITDGKIADRLIRERLDAADEIEALRAQLATALSKGISEMGAEDDCSDGFHRDDLAIAIMMQTLRSNIAYLEHPRKLAEISYAVVDAMLEARKVQP